MHPRSVAIIAALITAVSAPSIGTAAQITNVLPASASTDGSTTITIVGSGFSAAGNSVTVGTSPCPVTSELPEMIMCTVPEGTGLSHPIRVLDGAGVASPPYPFGYEPPVITAVTAASAPTAGGVRITIAGLNFGASANKVNATAGEQCDNGVLDNANGRFECTLPPGEGANVPIHITVDGQTSPPSSFSYDPPTITGVTPTRVSAGGGTVVTIRGNNFGLASSVTIGGTICPLDEQGHTELTCTAPPSSGAPPNIVVVAGGQVSNAAPFSYELSASKCDAAKWKAASSLTSCVGKVHAKGSTKGLAPDPDALAACEEKFAASCAKAETKNTDCSQPGTCDEIAARSCCRRKGWDGTIKGNIE